MERKKKNSLKSFLALTLAFIMVIGVSPVGKLAGIDFAELFGLKAAAEGDALTEGIYTYEIVDGTAQITDCDTTAAGDIVIPSELGGHPVTSIGVYAFNDCKGFTSVTIPDSVTSIGLQAFDSCTGLTSITIPGNVTHIDGAPFAFCKSLVNIIVDNNNEKYSSNDGVLFNKEQTLLVQYPAGKQNSTYSIPYGVTDVGYGAFIQCETLMDVTIPDSVTNIGYGAFAICSSLTDITIPDSVKIIDEIAFGGCNGLTSIEIPDSVTTIGVQAFSDCCNLTSVTIGVGVMNIGKNAFLNCDSLKNIYYRGTEEQWNQIVINDENSYLNNAVIHYEHIACDSHKWGSWQVEKDTIGESEYIMKRICSVCGETQTCPMIYTYEIVDGTAQITDCDTTAAGDIVIPSELEGHPVTSIGEYAFSSCESLTSVTIPDSVTSIGEYAFAGCKNLTSVKIGNDVATIGSWAFFGCIGLKNIVIPDNVMFIGAGAFVECMSLTSITVDKNNANYSSRDGVLFDKEQKTLIQYPVRRQDAEYTIPEGVEKIGAIAFYGCSGLTSVTIPDSVASIEEGAFGFCNGLTGVTIPDSVTNIGASAFAECRGLTSVTIGNGVTTIGDDAFRKCTGLTNVTIPDSVTGIGSDAFSDCTGLTSVTIPDSVEFLGSGVFSRCISLTSITVDKNNENYSSRDGVLFNKDQTTLIQYPAGNQRDTYIIPDSVTSIGSWAFLGCTGLTSITIPGSVTSIEEEAFYSCTGLTSITIPDSVTSIGGYAFSDCTSLTSITIPDSVTSIGSDAFSGCTGLTSITIPDSVTSIEEHVFFGCEKLATVNMGNGIIKIGFAAFEDCNLLKDVYFSGTEARWNKIVVEEANDCLKSAEIHYEYTTCDSHKWSNWRVTIEATYDSEGVMERMCSLCGETQTQPMIFIYQIYDGVASITGCYHEAMGNVTIPSAIDGCPVTSIGSYAFSGCTGLTGITIPNSVLSIGSYAFSDCTGLTGITIPNSVMSIGSYAFSGCTGLTSVTIPDSVTSLGSKLFADCTNLNSLTIGDGVTSIEEYAFSDLENLTSVSLGNGVESIGREAFADCKKLTNLTLGNSVKIIGLSAFSGCTALTNVVIPDSVIEIGIHAFSETGLTSITIPDGVETIGDFAFHKCSGLMSISVGENNKNYSSADGVLFNKDKTVIIQYPAGNQRDAYVVPGSVTSLGECAFYGCTGLTSITIPGSVTSIEEEAFYGCTGLTDVYYSGTEAEWKKIAIGAFNEELKNATIHYNGNPCTNHSWSEWTVIQPATAEAEGLRERTCLVCGEKETEAIPKLDFIYGDVNGDGKINGRDVVKLAKYLAAYDESTGTSSVTVSPGADVNGDGRIDGRDLVKLRKYLANYDESTGQSSVKLGPER